MKNKMKVVLLSCAVFMFANCKKDTRRRRLTRHIIIVLIWQSLHNLIQFTQSQ